MGSSTGRLRRLVNDLLTASRLQASRLEIQSADVLVGDVLAAAVATVTRTRPDAHIVTDPSPAVSVLGDLDRLTQAVENLLTNALRHGEPPVHVHSRTGDGAVDICVSDSGPGVAEEMQPRLFKRFATSRSRGGTGLGLYIVRELARAHGGDAFYEPAPGPEAGRFVIRLPRVGDAEPPSG
jgi:signal transduction histidine kinase